MSGRHDRGLTLANRVYFLGAVGVEASAKSSFPPMPDRGPSGFAPAEAVFLGMGSPYANAAA